MRYFILLSFILSGASFLTLETSQASPMEYHRITNQSERFTKRGTVEPKKSTKPRAKRDLRPTYRADTATRSGKTEGREDLSHRQGSSIEKHAKKTKVTKRDEGLEFRKTYTSVNSGFSISLPEEFIIESDSLTNEDGEMILVNGDQKVTVHPTDIVCQAGSTAARLCYTESWQKLQSEYKEAKNFNDEIVNQDLAWKSSSANQNFSNREYNTGRYFIFENAKKNSFAQFVFFGPDSTRIWEITWDNIPSGGKFLDESNVRKSFLTIYREENTNRTGLDQREQRTQDAVTSNGERRYESSKQNSHSRISFRATSRVYENELVTFAMPKTGRITRDDITRNSGNIFYEKSGMHAEFTATEEICDNQDSKLLRRCTDEIAQEFELAILKANENLLPLANDNFDLRLQSDVDYTYFGRFSLAYNSEGGQVGLLTFAEPEIGYIWTVRLEADDTLEMVWLRKFFSSIRFPNTKTRRKVLN